MDNAQILIYSAVFGGYDDVQEPVVPGRYLLITDKRAPSGWTEQRERPAAWSRQTARYWKTVGMPRTHQFSIWVDGNIQLRVLPQEPIQRWLLDTGADIALFKHPGHDCIYQEAQRCIKRYKDASERVTLQVARYHALGFPEHYGLGETTVLIRRNTPVVHAFNRRWWQEIEGGSVRDQLSFDYVRWLYGNKIRVHFVDGGVSWKRRQHEWFRGIGHNAP